MGILIHCIISTILSRNCELLWFPLNKTFEGNYPERYPDRTIFIKQTRKLTIMPGHSVEIWVLTRHFALIPSLGKSKCNTDVTWDCPDLFRECQTPNFRTWNVQWSPNDLCEYLTNIQWIFCFHSRIHSGQSDLASSTNLTQNFSPFLLLQETQTYQPHYDLQI